MLKNISIIPQNDKKTKWQNSAKPIYIVLPGFSDTFNAFQKGGVKDILLCPMFHNATDAGVWKQAD